MKIKNRKKSELPLEERKKVEKVCAVVLSTFLLGVGALSYHKDFEIKGVSNNTEVERSKFLQDVNGEWKQYDDIIEVTYENKKFGHKKVLIMGLEEEKENQRVFHSITEPLFYLVETTNRENNLVDYEIQTTGFSTEEARIEYSSGQKVTDVVSLNGVKEWVFEEIAEKEKLKEKQLNGENIAALPSPFSENFTTLMKYNSWLYKIGSDKRLTKEDLEIIEANTNSIHPNDGIISIKLQNNEYTQVADFYSVVENVEGRLELILGSMSEYNLLTGNKRKTIDYTTLGCFGEYIEENNIESIGYTTQLWPAWGDKDVEFVRINYGEDVLECLKENGFPLPCYDAKDFYKAYENQFLSMGARNKKKQ